MNNVFPESMNPLPDDPQEALKMLEKYIHYMTERIDFAFKKERGLTEVPEAEVVERLTVVERQEALTSQKADSAYGLASDAYNGLEYKVDKDGDKVLSDNNYTDTEKNKLGDLVEVEANPSETASTTMTTVRVGDTVYDLPSGGGGHTIVDGSGTQMTSRANLQFTGLSVSDDSTNDSTLVDASSLASDTPTFTEASTRTNISSGESTSTLWGKVKKFFTDLKTVAFTGSYSDLSNKPTIPTVNNATLTIQKNGTTVSTFTANASSNVTCNISDVASKNTFDNFFKSLSASNTSVSVGTANTVINTGVKVTVPSGYKAVLSAYISNGSAGSTTLIAINTTNDTGVTGNYINGGSNNVRTLCCIDTAGTYYVKIRKAGTGSCGVYLHALCFKV